MRAAPQFVSLKNAQKINHESKSECRAFPNNKKYDLNKKKKSKKDIVSHRIKKRISVDRQAQDRP